MAFKNSAGVKFNDNTELVIQADPDGTVESVFNKSNNTEYVGGGGGDLTTCTMTVEQRMDMSVPFLFSDNGQSAVMSVRQSFFPGEYTLVLYKGYCIGEYLGGTEPVITGDAVNTDGMLIISGSFTITL